MGSSSVLVSWMSLALENQDLANRASPEKPTLADNSTIRCLWVKVAGPKVLPNQIFFGEPLGSWTRIGAEEAQSDIVCVNLAAAVRALNEEFRMNMLALQ